MQAVTQKLMIGILHYIHLVEWINIVSINQTQVNQSILISLICLSIYLIFFLSSLLCSRWLYWIWLSIYTESIFHVYSVSHAWAHAWTIGIIYQFPVVEYTFKLNFDQIPKQALIFYFLIQSNLLSGRCIHHWLGQFILMFKWTLFFEMVYSFHNILILINEYFMTNLSFTLPCYKSIFS